MDHEQMSYPESIKHLAEKFNVTIEEVHNPDYDQAAVSKRESILIAMKYAGSYFSKMLFENEEGKNIGLSYFKERGFIEKTIDTFDLGYSLNSWDAFYQLAIKEGHSKEVLIGAGLIKEREDHKVFDFFRHRVMFPIHNVSGKIVAFGGRILVKSEKSPKYLNTPETEIYTKSKIVYGIYQAKHSIRQEDTCFLVEGYTDVISLHQNGVPNVVASSGTALTVDQIRLIKRFTKNVVLLFDGDKAGLKAALRGVDLLLEQDMNIQIVSLPEGEDPDSFIKSKGQEGFLNFVESVKKDFILFKAGLLISDSKRDPAKKAEAIKDIVESIARIEDPVKRAVYLQSTSKLFELKEEVLLAEINKIKRKQLKSQFDQHDKKEQIEELEQRFQPTIDHVEKVVNTSLYEQEYGLISCIMRYGDKAYEDSNVLTYFRSRLGRIQLEDKTLQKILDIYALELGDKIDCDISAKILRHEESEIQAMGVNILSSPYVVSENWTKHQGKVDLDATYKKDIKSTIDRYVMKRLLKLIDEFDTKLHAEPDEKKQLRLIMERQKLIEQKRILSEVLGLVVIR